MSIEQSCWSISGEPFIGLDWCLYLHDIHVFQEAIPDHSTEQYRQAHSLQANLCHDPPNSTHTPSRSAQFDRRTALLERRQGAPHPAELVTLPALMCQLFLKFSFSFFWMGSKATRR
jgi:hypothetical protein